jgi:hypothetical protein
MVCTESDVALDATFGRAEGVNKAGIRSGIRSRRLSRACRVSLVGSETACVVKGKVE